MLALKSIFYPSEHQLTVYLLHGVLVDFLKDKILVTNISADMLSLEHELSASTA